jgi:putative transposase
MLLTYQYRLQPTLLQGATLNHWGELLCRTRSQFDRSSLTSEPIGDIPSNVDYHSQAADLKETKGLFPEYKEIYADCQQQNVMGLDKSWKGWLIPDKIGRRGGKPRLKKQGDICSFTLPRVNSPKAGLHLTDGILKLSKIGEIPVVLHRPILDGFPIKQATIVSKADGWYVSFAIEDTTVPDSLPMDEIKSAVGSDVELEKFLTTSNAEAIAAPQFYRKAETNLSRKQRKLARHENGSHNYNSQGNKMARLHLHSARQRKDFQYSVAHDLCTAYDLIGLEKLNIKGLARTRLAQSILHAPWRTFLTIVPAVGVKHGKHPQEVDARSRSIQCCNYEERVVKDLSIPVQDCPNGGVSLDRDLNARLNLLKRTVGQSFAAGGGLVDAQSGRQELSFVNLSSPRHTLLAVDGGSCYSTYGYHP